jgi:hypothetical protein
LPLRFDRRLPPNFAHRLIFGGGEVAASLKDRGRPLLERINPAPEIGSRLAEAQWLAREANE